MVASPTWARVVLSRRSIEICASPSCASALRGFNRVASRKACCAAGMSPLARAARPSQIFNCALSGFAFAAFWNISKASFVLPSFIIRLPFSTATSGSIASVSTSCLTTSRALGRSFLASSRREYPILIGVLFECAEARSA